VGLFALPVLAVEDNSLPEYVPVTGIAGNLSSVGSDTLANLMIRWSDSFRRFYPNVIIQIQAAGSATATPALTERTANVGPVSRELRDSEIEAFENRYGYRPNPNKMSAKIKA
jgi:phosphate transport system substrate-binding protein